MKNFFLIESTLKIPNLKKKSKNNCILTNPLYRVHFPNPIYKLIVDNAEPKTGVFSSQTFSILTIYEILQTFYDQTFIFKGEINSNEFNL